MGWEHKGRQRYFYESVRVDGKPRRAYFGHGAEAEERARIAAENTQRRQAERATRCRVAQAEVVLDDAARMVALLTRAVLVANGLHEHHGDWRRRRHTDDRDNDDRDAQEASQPQEEPQAQGSGRAAEETPRWQINHGNGRTGADVQRGNNASGCQAVKAIGPGLVK
jgi:hypothetical protein